MDPSGDTVGRVTFGVFEADLRVRELRRQHIRVRLPDQSFLILSMLLEHPGELVKREEIRKTLWPADTFVDFDHGLNNAINRLREALGDSADSPRFIETLPRRGYRFIGNVNPSPAEKAATLETPPAEQLAQDPGIDAASRKRSQFFEAIRYRWLLWSISALLAVALLVAFELRSVPLPPSSRSFVLPPEGTIFNLIGDAGGSVAVSVDGTKLAFVTIDPKGTSLIWIRHLGKLNADPLEGTEGATFPFWSPDGRRIAFFADGKLKIISLAGGLATSLLRRFLWQGGKLEFEWNYPVRSDLSQCRLSHFGLGRSSHSRHEDQ